MLPNQSSLPTDPVLERLQRITKSHDQPHHISSTANTAITPQNSIQPHTSTDTLTHHYDPYGNNVNNSSIKSQPFSGPMFNKNSKASSNIKGNENSGYEIDNIGMQIIGDAKNRVFDIGQSQEVSSPVPLKPLNKHKMCHHNDSTNQSHTLCSGAGENKTKKPLRDLPVNQMSNIAAVVKEYQKDDTFGNGNSNDKQMKDVENQYQVYHQFLQAEKPNSDLNPKEQHSEPGKMENIQEYSSGLADETHVGSKRHKRKEQAVSSSKINVPTAQTNGCRRKAPSKSLSKMHIRQQEDVCSSDDETVCEKLAPSALACSASSKSSKDMQHLSHTEDVSGISTDGIDDDGDVREKRKSHPVSSLGDPKKGKDNSNKTKKTGKCALRKASHSAHSADNSDKEVTLPQLCGQHVQSAIGQVSKS